MLLPGGADSPLPSVLLAAGPRAGERTVEFFTAHIRNPNTREAYLAQHPERLVKLVVQRGLIPGKEFKRVRRQDQLPRTMEISGGENLRTLPGSFQFFPAPLDQSGQETAQAVTEAEIVEVWRAFEAEGDPFGDLFKLLLLTGQRRSEVGGMDRSELSDLDSDRPLWEIPGKRTKNGRPHLVPLVPQTASIIADLPWIGDGGLLFTTTGATPVSCRSPMRIGRSCRFSSTS